MGLVPVFKALVDPAGKVILRETERARRRKWLESIAGSSVEVIVRRVPKQRSLDVNAYIHAVPVPLVAEYTGDCIEDAKRNLMRSCFGYVRDVPTGLVKPWMEHTSSMTDEEASYFIEWAPPFALERFNGLEIPMPGEVEFK